MSHIERIRWTGLFGKFDPSRHVLYGRYFTEDKGETEDGQPLLSVLWYFETPDQARKEFRAWRNGN
jgi:hypothetical protein